VTSGGRTVELTLLRHAHAGDPAEWNGPDEKRPLSRRGRKQALRLARFLKAVGFRPDALITSPKVRAVQTADALADELDLHATVDPRLSEGVTLDVLEAILASADNPGRPVLVGHDPDFSEIASALTGRPGLMLAKGAIARFDARRPLVPGSGELRWLVPPDLLRPDR